MMQVSESAGAPIGLLMTVTTSPMSRCRISEKELNGVAAASMVTCLRCSDGFPYLARDQVVRSLMSYGLTASEVNVSADLSKYRPIEGMSRSDATTSEFGPDYCVVDTWLYR